ncbi:hypothetical protein [Methylobacterium oxalidis]|nr:hypothetical protein [Methylobacterium oxalidis]
MSAEHNLQAISQAALRRLREIQQINDTTHNPAFRMGRPAAVFRFLKDRGLIEVRQISANFGDGFTITDKGRETLRSSEKLECEKEV